MTATKEKKKLFNNNLISLKVVVFFAFIGFATIHLLNTILPFYLGLNFNEYRLITIITPLVSIIGPFVVGPLADHLAGKNPNNFGRCLRILTAICLLLSALFYGILCLIPQVHRSVAIRPNVSFACDANGGIVYQERCSAESVCHHWNQKHGDLILTNCSYTCQNLKEFQRLYFPWLRLQPSQLTLSTVGNNDHYDYSDEDAHSTSPTKSTYYSNPIKRRKRAELFDDDGEDFAAEELNVVMEERSKRSTNYGDLGTLPPVRVEPPHLCEKKTRDDGSEYISKCHVYTEHTESLKLKVTMKGATNDENEKMNDTHSEEQCLYPLDGFRCNIPQQQINFMIHDLNHPNCKPMVECDVIDPYSSRSSVLADSACMKTSGDENVTVTTYFILRPFAAIFLLAALALLNTAIVIATRETSTGRGEVCRQYVWGALAWTCFIPSLLGYKDDIHKIYDIEYLLDQSHTDLQEFLHTYLTVLIITAVVSLVIAALILLFASGMPLSPPEWWWHTKTGMLVYPMSAIRKYFPEMIALCIITIILGIFWSSIHSYTLWVYKDWSSISYIGCVFVLLLFFNVDKFIEYCGHSNILTAIFALYIIRFAGLQINDDDTTLTIIMEIIEPFYVTVAWITVILYMRHIIPRKYTATGQAILVIAHFCTGKFLGALFGLERDETQPERNGCIYLILAAIACVLSLAYFIIYNFLLAPRCTAKPQPAPQLTLTNLSQQQPNNNSLQTNGATNGNYTPLRVYHNERGKKGQFRY